MIYLVLLLAIATAPDTTRCTWEGRLPDRGEYRPAVSRPGEVARLTTDYRNGTKNDRMAAVQSLGQLAMPRQSRCLLKLWPTRASTLCSRQSGHSVEFRIRALHSSNPQIQQAAACGLGRTGGTDVLPALRELLGSTNVFVASAAQWSIGRIKDIPSLATWRDH